MSAQLQTEIMAEIDRIRADITSHFVPPVKTEELLGALIGYIAELRVHVAVLVGRVQKPVEGP